jgi:hypothetical protein
MNETKTVTIRSGLLDGITAVVARLNKRAAKLGVDPVVLTSGNERRIEKTHGEGKPSTFPLWLDVTLSLNIPKLADWSFVATLQHTPTGNLLLTVPRAKDATVLDLSAYRTCAPKCDHCTLQRNRNDTYIVQHTDGTLKQVGKQCLVDFTGYGKTPEAVASFAEWLSSVLELIKSAGSGGDGDNDRDSCGGDGCRQDDGFGLATYLAFVVACSNKWGFRTGKQAEETQSESTKNTALCAMFPPIGKPSIIKPTEDDQSFANDARQWAAAIVPNNDFEHNLVVVASNDVLIPKNAGIAAFLIEAFRRHLGMVAKRNALAPSVHFGTVGERIRGLKLTYLGNSSFDSNFGTCFIHRFRTENGSDVIWKTGTGDIATEGEVVTVDASVKSHGDYKGRAQTVLTRVKALENKVLGATPSV